MALSIGRSWMARQRLGEVGRQVHWSTVTHCSVGEYGNFGEDWHR